MTIIYAITSDQVLTATVLPKIACNNQNTVKLHVDFDSTWNDYAKSAVFYTDKCPTRYEKRFSSEGNCIVPPEVLTEKCKLFISVKGAKVNKVKSSTELAYKISKGTPSVLVSDATGTMYEQVLGALGDIGGQSSKALAEIAVERERINNIAALGAGSTTGDAELQDIRVGADGKTYANAGDAVRGQYKGALDMFGSVLKTDADNLFNPMTCSDATALATATGATMSNAEYWCSDYINVGGLAKIRFNIRPYKIVWYNSEKTLVLAQVAGQYGEVFADIPDGAVYARVQYAAANLAYSSRFSLIYCDATKNISEADKKYTINPDCVSGLDRLGAFSEDKNNILNPSNCLKGFAFETATGAIFANTAYWLSDYVAIGSIKNVQGNKSIYKYAWYDADKNFLQANGEAPDGAAYILLQFAESVVPYDSRFDVIVCDANIDIIGVNPRYYIKETVKENRGINAIGEYKFAIPLQGTSYMSDHTFINGQLFVINASSDDHTEYAGVTVYDVDVKNKTSQYVRTFKHNLGHANTIDYCAENGCLILGNGSGNSALLGEIYILPDAANKATWEYADCIKIDLSTKGWGIKTNVVWGEHNNGEYNIAYVITNNNANVRKILLTKTNGQFDGGYILLGEWETEAVDVNQGSVFRNGKLYIAIGHSQVWLLEYTLNADGTIAQHQRKDIFYDANGQVLTTPFAEGVTVEDGYIFFGASNGKVLVYKDTAGGSVKATKGVKGEQGDDYVLTDADKTEIINRVYALLPVYDGAAVVE